MTATEGMEVLDPSQCWALVREADVGRLAVSVANRPDIFPINFIVDHGTVVFRTAEGTKLAAAVLGTSVAFEVDGYDYVAGDRLERRDQGQGDGDPADARAVRRRRAAAVPMARGAEAPHRPHHPRRDHGPPLPRHHPGEVSTGAQAGAPTRAASSASRLA